MNLNWKKMAIILACVFGVVIAFKFAPLWASLTGVACLSVGFVGGYVWNKLSTTNQTIADVVSESIVVEDMESEDS